MKTDNRKYLVAGLRVTLGVLLVYVLSVGLAYRLMRTGTIQQNTFLKLYGPINTLCERSELFERILDDYFLELFYSDSRNLNMWLEQLGKSQSSTALENVSTNGVPHKR